ncbi:MAG: PIN domain-containing protein [Puniceicoccaceae bacterium]|nr:MAG: PIN domain-containing protein [Puniceicoccaceae bacterium]
MIADLRGRILVDTNVLIYATLRGDVRYEKANEVIELRHRKDVELCLSVQNLAEMYPNLTGPRNQPPDSPELARAKIDSIAGLDYLTIFPLSLSITRRALQLCERYSIRRQQYFDMQLAAMMLEEGIGVILTENVKDFEPIEGIRTMNPFL